MHQFRHRARHRTAKMLLNFFHLVNIVTPLSALTGKAYILKVADCVLLAIHIIGEITRILCLNLRVVDAGARIAPTQRVNTAPFPENIGGLFDAESVNRDVVRGQIQHLVKGAGKFEEIVLGKASDQIGVDLRNSGPARCLKGGEKFFYTVEASDTFEDSGVQRLGIDADTGHAAASGDRHPFRP